MNRLFIITTLLIFLQALLVTGFTTVQLQPPSRSITTTTTTRLHGWLDFKTFHGQGSGESENELDEQWRVQQEILAARRGGGLDKSHLKQKYAGGAKGDLSSLGGGSGDDGRKQQQNDGMWIEDKSDNKTKNTKKKTSQSSNGKAKFFWEK